MIIKAMVRYSGYLQVSPFFPNSDLFLLKATYNEPSKMDSKTRPAVTVMVGYKLSRANAMKPTTAITSAIVPLIQSGTVFNHLIFASYYQMSYERAVAMGRNLDSSSKRDIAYA
jgi:hypothetical protein